MSSTSTSTSKQSCDILLALRLALIDEGACPHCLNYVDEEDNICSKCSYDLAQDTSQCEQ